MTVSKGENLIFLISQPRAGSTLLQLMLSGHPEIATTSEPWMALHPLYALRKTGIYAEYDSKLAHEALTEFLKQSGVDEGFYKRQIASFLLSFYRRATKHQNKKIFLDKTPRYYLIANELIELFPQAKFIILFRNPMSVLNSILKTWIKKEYSVLRAFKEDLMIAPQKLVDCVKDYPDRCLKVKYEELVTKPEAVLMEICQFLKVLYSDKILNYRSNPEWKFGDPVDVHKSGRPSIEYLDKWKKDFVSSQEKLFAVSYLEELGPKLIKEMGYNYHDIKSSIDTSIENLEVNLISWKTAMNKAHPFMTELDTIRAERDALIESISWKITAPLRALAGFFKRR